MLASFTEVFDPWLIFLFKKKRGKIIKWSVFYLHISFFRNLRKNLSSALWSIFTRDIPNFSHAFLAFSQDLTWFIQPPLTTYFWQYCFPETTSVNEKNQFKDSISLNNHCLRAHSCVSTSCLCIHFYLKFCSHRASQTVLIT